MSDKVIVFLGPTVDARKITSRLECCCFPPAALGDIYRASLRNPSAIALIDGYFETKPAVWHKEILHALQLGIRVYGSSSMGALRAAELRQFGMVGVGAIFEAYATGVIDDDAEVALIHGPEELGYPALSVPLVEVRHLAASASATIKLSTFEADTLIRAAQRIYYKNRTWNKLAADLAEIGALTDDLRFSISEIAPTLTSIKELDALALCDRIREDHGKKGPSPEWRLEQTEWWSAVSTLYCGLPFEANLDQAFYDLLHDEIRLNPAIWKRLSLRATRRHLAAELANSASIHPSLERIQLVADKLRNRLGLADPVALQKWLLDNDLSRDEFTRAMRKEAMLGSVQGYYSRELLAEMITESKFQGLYQDLVAAARSKFERLQSKGEHSGSNSTEPADRARLTAWYFEEYLRRETPVDLNQFGALIGYDSLDELFVAVARLNAVSE